MLFRSNNGIKLHGDHVNPTITNNKISNIGLIIGMGGSGDGNYIGMYIEGQGSIIQHNIIENTGYIGINFGGSNTLISYNLINGFNLVKSDGGGIYTYVGTGTPSSNLKVTNNIVLNGKGYGGGLSEGADNASGIYLDDCTEDVEVLYNSVANCATAGIFLHNAHERSEERRVGKHCSSRWSPYH